MDMTTTRANVRRNEEDNVDQEVPPQSPPQDLIDPLAVNLTNAKLSEFGKLSLDFVGSYEILSGVGKVGCELELVIEWYRCMWLSMSLGYRRVLEI
uniref:Uncharacterized protein n=1 Tax=Solanum tuberosum TaxID=4113 RepID=M1DJA0_SOLTU